MLQPNRVFGSALPSAVVCCLLAAACSSGESAQGRAGGGPPGREGGAVPVAAIEARSRDLARTVTVTGPVEPIRTVSVSAQTAGVVLRVLVEEGDRVRAGTLLAELDGRETSAQLQRAQAVLVNAEGAFERAQQLNARGLNTAADLDAARSAHDIAKADVELWRTRVAFSRLSAPVSGVVTAKRVERGSAVSTNQVMFEIAEDSLLVVRVRVSELDVVQLRPDYPVAVRLDAYPEASIAGRIRRIFPSADAASRLVPVEVALARTAAGVEARPGFLARVEFALDRREAVLAVPTSAVGVSNGGAYVFVVDADTLVRRSVETGVTAAGWIEIAQGLEPGERVVSSGHVNLRQGTAVRVSEGVTTGDSAP
ncbi:MAG: efflux RND transporter periplasmic adaptor subunit [Gemmatimonadota bacterium]|nr:MAG: efflux RND transporter periplasmic adaptor subunit [Gemmatimonadota bacterium]